MAEEELYCNCCPVRDFCHCNTPGLYEDCPLLITIKRLDREEKDLINSV